MGQEVIRKKDLEVIRGDTHFYKFQRVTKAGDPITEIADAVYFTVKDTTLPKNYKFQKTIDDMDFDEEGYYHLRLEPQDTNGLKLGEYLYDVEVIHDDITKTIARGKFIVTYDVTFVENEG